MTIAATLGRFGQAGLDRPDDPRAFSCAGRSASSSWAFCIGSGRMGCWKRHGAATAARMERMQAGGEWAVPGPGGMRCAQAATRAATPPSTNTATRPCAGWRKRSASSRIPGPPAPGQGQSGVRPVHGRSRPPPRPRRRRRSRRPERSRRAVRLVVDRRCGTMPSPVHIAAVHPGAIERQGEAPRRGPTATSPPEPPDSANASTTSRAAASSRGWPRCRIRAAISKSRAKAHKDFAVAGR